MSFLSPAAGPAFRLRRHKTRRVVFVPFKRFAREMCVMQISRYCAGRTFSLNIHTRGGYRFLHALARRRYISQIFRDLSNASVRAFIYTRLLVPLNPFFYCTVNPVLVYINVMEARISSFCRVNRYRSLINRVER